MGDIILTTPVVESLKKEFSPAKVDVMVAPAGRDLFKGYDGVRDIIIYNKKSSLFSKLALFGRLFKKRYSLVVDLRNTVLPVILGAPYITNPFRHGPKPRIHKKDAHLGRLEEIGIGVSGANFNIPVREEDESRVERLLGEIKGGTYVVVSPGAKSHVKRWHLKRFARLCDIIKQDLGYEVVLVGDEFDRVVVSRLLFYMTAKPVNLSEKTNIRELAYLIKMSALLITNDSAPLHVGSAVDAKILAFFGPTDDKKYGPLSRNSTRVLRENLPCAPCEAAQCVNPKNKYECLKNISVDRALGAVRELLKENTNTDAREIRNSRFEIRTDRI